MSCLLLVIHGSCLESAGPFTSPLGEASNRGPVYRFAPPPCCSVFHSFLSAQTTTSSSTDSSSSSSPAGLNAPRYGTMVPNRVFVGGIATSTTEAELQELFSHYGHVTNTKIIVDRAGVSKGYGFVTFDTPEGAQRAQAAGNNNLMLRDRRLNVAPAIKKQPFTSRAYAPHHAESVQQAAPTGTVVYHQNGVPYMYHNGTAFFHHPDTFYQYAPQAAAQNLQASSAAVATTSSPAATTTGYPILYQPYYPQQAFQYPNAWSAPNGQWRWAPPVSSCTVFVPFSLGSCRRNAILKCTVCDGLQHFCEVRFFSGSDSSRTTKPYLRFFSIGLVYILPHCVCFNKLPGTPRRQVDCL